MSTSTITCPSCGFAKSVQNEKIPTNSTVVTCSKCNKKFDLQSNLEQFSSTPSSVVSEQVNNHKTMTNKSAGKMALIKGCMFIGFSIPFFKVAYTNAMFSLEPNTMGGGSKATFFGAIAGALIFMGVKSLLNVKKNA